MYDVEIKKHVLATRKGGKSIRDISKNFNIPFSTISFWCRDIELSPSLINKIVSHGKTKAKLSLLKYSEEIRRERIQRTFEQMKGGGRDIGKLSKRDIYIFGLGLYWGEGYKESNSELGLTNSNPRVIKFYIQWLRNQNISKKNLIFRLSINGVFRSQEKEIKKFWIKYLGVKEEQFSATTIIKTNLKKAFTERKNHYNGVLRVKVRKGLALKNRILGAIEHISSNSN